PPPATPKTSAASKPVPEKKPASEAAKPAAKPAAPTVGAVHTPPKPVIRQAASSSSARAAPASAEPVLKPYVPPAGNGGEGAE
ncbi:MAG TPA: rod shape-determining protein MreC, partial [Asticcacaulis sp.]